MWLCLTFCQILSLLFSVWEAVATPGEAQIAKTETFCDVNGETFKELQKQIQQCYNKMDYYIHQNSTNWLQNLICLCRVSSIHSGRISATCRVSMSLSSVYPWCYNRGSLVCHSSCMWVEPHPFVNLSSPPPVSSLFVMNVPLVSPLPPSRSVAEVFLCPPELLSSHCWCSFHRTISDMTVSMHDLCAVCRPKVTEGIIALTPKVIPGGVKAKSVMDKLSSKC